MKAFMRILRFLYFIVNRIKVVEDCHHEDWMYL